MSRYVRIADKKAAEAKERLRSGLQGIADKPESTNAEKLEALSKLTDLHIAEERADSKAGPLREEIDRQAKLLRDLREELRVANTAAMESTARIAELETKTSDLTTERNGLKSDVSRLGSELATSRNDTRVADAKVRSADAKLLDANKRADVLALNLHTLLPVLRKHYGSDSGLHESVVTDLFLTLAEHADRTLFTDLGWTEAKFNFWRVWLTKANRLPTDKIIELLHRSNCSCTQHEPETTIRDEGERRLLTDNDRVFLAAFLKHGGIDADLEISKLVATHRKDWTERNSPELRLTPPLSHREITPFGTRVVNWGED
jgi:hypothetical protein